MHYNLLSKVGQGTKVLYYTVLSLPVLLLPFFASAGANLTLLNASYDPTRELYAEYNAAFARHWHTRTGQKVDIRQSHGGSGKQARAVIDGLRADVVTLALAYDIDAIAKHGKMLPSDWQKRLPENSTPYTSTIVLLVRRGNPKNIKDWPDLIRPEVEVITPNPRTSGGARWNYLAAWGYALKALGSEEQAFEFMKRLFANVPVLEAGARSAATTFVQRGIGDVLISWENEAILASKESAGAGVQLIRPSVSILAEPPVTWVDRNTTRKGTTEVAKDYLLHLYSEEGRAIITKHHFRPGKSNPDAFSGMRLFTIDEMFGGWQNAHKKHFSDGGTFDRVQQTNR